MKTPDEKEQLITKQINDLSMHDTVKGKRVISLDLDDKTFLDKVGIESPVIEADMEDLRRFLSRTGGTIVISTDDYEMRLNKNSDSTDIRITFANSSIEVVGPEASFDEKAVLVNRFLNIIKTFQLKGPPPNIIENEVLGYG